MPEAIKKQIFGWKDGLYIIAFIIMVAGYLNSRGNLIAEQALQKDQVDRNTAILTTYNLPILAYKMDEMDKKLDEVLDLLKE